MELKNRRKLFYSLAFIFCLLGIGLISYSSGWAIDFKTLSIKKTGGLFIETGTPDTFIKFGKKTAPSENFLFNKGTFIDNLFPKTYAVEVSKEGYQSWKKTLEIKPALVTKTLPIFLMPQKPALELISKNSKNFWLGPNQTIARLNSADKLFINEETALGNQVLGWSAKGDEALTFDSANNVYYLIDTTENNSALNINLTLKTLLDEELVKVRLDPRDKNKIIIKTPQGLYAFDTAKLKLSQLSKQPVNALLVFGDDIIWASKTRLYSLYQSATGQNPLADILTKEIIAEKNTNVELSPNKERLILLRKNTADFLVYFLRDEEALNKKTGEFVKLNYLSNLPLEFNWHKSSNYLFAQYPSGLYFGEVDGRDSINLQLIIGSLEKYQYDSVSNILYILKAGSLYKLDLK